MEKDNIPYILEETADFAVVFKPPKMHCTSNKQKLIKTKENTLYDWYADQSPCFDIMHRLDYETHGLVLFAKNEKSFNFFKDLQDKGEFVKEYSAICVPTDNNISNNGFPEYIKNYHGVHRVSRRNEKKCDQELCVSPCPPWFNSILPSLENPFVIESYFRPYGPGRKLVRPVIEDGKKHKEIAKDKGNHYRTEIINIDGNVFTVRIKRGFRHQIRCHLCWVGFPILNDPLYSFDVQGILALRAHKLLFIDPAAGNLREYGIKPLNSSCLMPPLQRQKDLPAPQVK